MSNNQMKKIPVIIRLPDDTYDVVEFEGGPKVFQMSGWKPSAFLTEDGIATIGYEATFDIMLWG